MPSSGGSVSDAPIEKTVDGQHHQLAYITPGEAQSLVSQGGKPTMTNEGVMAYPPGMGDPNYASAESNQGGSPNQGPAGGASAGGDYGGNVNPSQEYAGHTVQEQRDYRDDPDAYKAKHGGDVQPEETHWTDEIKDGISNYISSGGTIGLGIKLTGAVLSKIGEYSKELQKKAMTMSLNGKLKSIQKQKDFHPGAYGYKISDIQDDMDGIADGTFTQTDFTKKYGSSDPGSGDGSTGDRLRERDAMNIMSPIAPYIVGGTAPKESQAAKWYANLGNTGSNQFQFSFANELATAKAKQAGILGNQSAVGILAVSQSPFYDFLKENKLDKGIL